MKNYILFFLIFALSAFSFAQHGAKSDKSSSSKKESSENEKQENDSYSNYQTGSSVKWKSISLGGINHASAIKEDGTLWAWGINLFGEVGSGTDDNVYFPLQIGNDNSWIQVCSGRHHSLALKNDGTLWSWGSNRDGQLGNGENMTLEKSLIPIQVGNEKDWKYIATKYDHCLAIKNDGTLWAWGNNVTGQLGDGTNINRSVPTQVGMSNKWKSAATGNYHTLAIAEDGSLWAWGGNASGQLGDNFGGFASTPKLINDTKKWINVVAGLDYSLAIRKDNTLWAFGSNLIGLCGNGKMEIFQPIPNMVDDNSQDYIFVSAGNHHTFGIKKDGTLWGFGSNIGGELGDFTNTLSPKQFGNDKDWAYVSGGQHFTMAIKKDGTLWAWGSDNMGAWGIGDRGDKGSNIPFQIIH